MLLILHRPFLGKLVLIAASIVGSSALHLPDGVGLPIPDLQEPHGPARPNNVVPKEVDGHFRRVTANTTIITPERCTSGRQNRNWIEGHDHFGKNRVEGGNFVHRFLSGGNYAYTLHDAGLDVWGHEDSFGFFFRPRTCKDRFKVSTYVTNQKDTNRWAKAGLMLRTRLKPLDGRNVFVALTPGKGFIYQFRKKNGGKTRRFGETIPAVEGKITIIREKNNITAYIGDKQIGSVKIKFGGFLIYGLVVTSHNKDEVSQATFYNFSLTEF